MITRDRATLVVVLVMAVCGCSMPPAQPAARLQDPGAAVAQSRGACCAALHDLPAADYPTAERIATELAPYAAEVLPALLVMTENASPQVRRNALRAIGRAAGGLPDAASVPLRAALLRLLVTERDTSVMQEVIWLLDTRFFPADDARPALEALALAAGRAPLLRARAARAATRLIAVAGAGTGDTFLAAALASADPGVVAAAAPVAARRRGLDAALDAAYASYTTPPACHSTAVAPASIAAAHQGRSGASGISEVPLTTLAAAAALARARDTRDRTALLAALRTTCEAQLLPARGASPLLVVRAAAAAAIPPLLVLAATTQRAFAQLVGPRLAAPTPAEPRRTPQLLVFGSRAAFQRYMQAFVGSGADGDGLYLEEQSILFTYARGAGESANTLEATVVHELGHAFAARQIFPGGWRSPAAHRIARGWADEGLAEYLAGALVPATRVRRLADLCARRELPTVIALTTARVGYDQIGTFDYAAAWGLSAFLATNHPLHLRTAYAGYRSGAPDLRPLHDLEAAWHGWISAQCNR